MAAVRKQSRKGSAGGGARPVSHTDLNELPAALSADRAGTSDLRSFLAGTSELTSEERKLIVRQALVFVEQNYAHLPLKRAMHSVDPVQRLKLLLQNIELSDPPLPESEFHREMTDHLSQGPPHKLSLADAVQPKGRPASHPGRKLFRWRKKEISRLAHRYRCQPPYVQAWC